MGTLLMPRSFPKLMAVMVLLATGLLLASGTQPTSADMAQTRDPRQPAPTQRPRSSPTARPTTQPRSTATSRQVTQPALASRPARTGTAGFNIRTSTPITAQGAPTATALAVRVNSTATAFASKVAPTLTALAIKVNVTATLPASEASAAISSYASSVLGTNVTVSKAGGATGDVAFNANQPQESATAQSIAVDLAVKNYTATLSNGAATLSYGTGTVSGNITLDVQDESLGVYALVVNSTGTLNAQTALNLALTTFPGLNGLTYKEYTSATGFTWYATSAVPTIDVKTGKVTTTTQTVLLYVAAGGSGKASITASVGRGQYATLLDMPAGK